MTFYVGRMTTETEIANRIEAARIAANRSVAWLAEASGIADKTLRRRFKVPAQFTLAELSAVATALGVEVEQFLDASREAVAA